MKSTVFLILSTAMLVSFLPLQYLMITTFYIACVIVCWDYGVRNRNVANILVMSVSAMVCMLYYVLNVESILPHVGPMFYGAIAILSLLSAALKKPFTLKSSDPKRSELWFHIIMDVIIGVANLISIFLVYALAPSFSYIIIPLAISIGSVLFSHIIVNWCFHFLSLGERLDSAH